MTEIIEIAWARDALRLTYIAENIADLVGYTAEEILARPGLILSDASRSQLALLMTGEANHIMSRSFATALLHRDGGECPCEFVAICRYDGEGKFAEAWGAIRCRPMQHQFADVESWWANGLCNVGRQTIHSLARVLIL